MVRSFGKMADKLAQRLEELASADTLADISHLPPPRCHALKGNRSGQFSVDLMHPYRLIFTPDHEPVPLTEDGGIDLRLVTKILIISIDDTHKN